jgi:hypothetical protein
VNHSQSAPPLVPLLVSRQLHACGPHAALELADALRRHHESHLPPSWSPTTAREMRGELLSELAALYIGLQRDSSHPGGSLESIAATAAALTLSPSWRRYVVGMPLWAWGSSAVRR